MTYKWNLKIYYLGYFNFKMKNNKPRDHRKISR